jgi:3-hydroxyisobutyrate dehydrogenase-like beta-hydroxyacid dehydrogenase
MGRTVGRALAASGAEVVWCSAGRSSQTRQRAEAEGFTEVATLGELSRQVAGIVSVCPPGAAVDVAAAVAAAGFDGWYLDANAVSPATVAAVGAALTDDGELIDGGIVGPPADEAGTTRLYLSGSGAETIAELFSRGVLEPIVISGTTGAASALKMLYAAYTKGTGALLLAIISAAHRLGVATTLQAEWERSLPDLPDRAAWLLRRSGVKAWRFEPEMREIAATLAAAGLPDGFHLAAADVYHRLAELRLEGPVEPERTLRLLLDE